jgi:hypothetical protein
MHLVMLSAALLVFSINIDLLSVRVDKLSVHNQYRKRSANPIPVQQIPAELIRTHILRTSELVL